jgi:hypothetical protein
VTLSATSEPRPIPYEGYGEEDRGYGWVVFAAVLLLLLGTMNILEGLAALGNAKFFVHDAHYVFGSLRTWGWVAVIIGVLQLLVAVGIFMKNQLSRWTGVVILGASALAQLLMMPAYPFWSLTLFAIDILAVYGLIAYGKRIGED